MAEQIGIEPIRTLKVQQSPIILFEVSCGSVILIFNLGHAKKSGVLSASPRRPRKDEDGIRTRDTRIGSFRSKQWLQSFLYLIL